MNTGYFSLEDNYISVNYHYVRNPSQEWRGVYPCSVKEFESQIKFLSNSFKIVSLPEVFNAAKNNLAGKFCALTFDDGLTDHYRNVFPVLKKYGAFGTFFIITSTFEDNLPSTHKTHVLLSKVSVDDLIDNFNSFISTNYPQLKDKYLIPKDNRIENRRSYDNIPNANLKEVLISLPTEVREEFLDTYFRKLNLREQDLSRQLFMTKSEVGELYKEGMIIGNHTHNHYTYDLIDEDMIREDMVLSSNILKEITGSNPDVFSYPNGRYSKIAIKVLGKLGFNYAATIKKKAITKDDEPLLIPRYDTNNIKEFTKNYV